MYFIDLFIYVFDIFCSTSVHGIETIENYNPLVDLWHSAERVQSLHGYLPINVTLGLDERPFISYDTLEGINSILFMS